MKLTGVEIHPANSSDVAVLSFRDPRGLNPYNVKAITGLDAEAIVSRSHGTSGFADLSLENRDVVLRIGLNPDFSLNKSYSDLRDDLYKMIASSRTGKIQLQFMNGPDAVAAISGFVSKFEAAYFEKAPEVQLTVKCEEPMLKGLTSVSVPVTDLEPYNTVISDDKSTAPHGFMFEMDISAYLNSITITDPDDSSWSFEVVSLSGFIPDDVLVLSSEYNNKGVYVLRGGVTIIQLADVITPGSVWPMIFPGDNSFSFTNYEYLSWKSITYYPTYWGV